MRGRGEGSIRKRRRADGTVSWEARIRIFGRQHSFYDDTKSGAMAKAHQARADSVRGNPVHQDSITVAEHLDRWLEVDVRPRVRARTYESYSSLSANHIVPAIGRVRLVQLTPGHVQRMLARVVASGLSESTAGRVRAVLSSALNAAQLDYGLPRNVARLAKVPRSPRPAFTPEEITPEDAHLILAAVEKSRLRPLVLFAIATGMRQGEQLALRWRDIDMKRRTVTVRHAVDVRDGQRVLGRPKTLTAQRSLRLSDLAIAALEMRQAQEADDRILAGDRWQELDLVFANPTGGIRDGNALRRNFQGLLSRRGLKPIRWHALRRLFAAVLQDHGVPLERIRDLMGHSELRVTEGYAYTLPETLDRDMGAIDAEFGPENSAGKGQASSE